MPKKLAPGEVTDKVEIRMPASLKQAAENAARVHGDGDISSWVRALMRAELNRLGMMPTPPPAPPPMRSRPKRKEGR